jgi:RNA ligase (TIGR02306 family)
MPVSILGDRAGDFNIGDDVSESLGIVKYVNDRYDHSMGEIVGRFPFFIPSTELTRIQNCFDEVKEKYSHLTFEVTTKMNGSSLTCYFNNGTVGVCSKDIEYKYHRKNFDNPYVLFGKRILDLLFRNGENMAIQGELCGPMRYLQNNERLDGPKIFVFNVFDIDNQKSFLPYDRREFIEDNFDFIVENAPLIHKSLKLDDFKTIDDLVAFADGESYTGNHRREGVVFKSNDYDDNGKIISFKIISNKFLLKEGWQ